MKNKKVARRLAALLLIISLCAVAAVADTIRLKDGTVIRGQIIGFRDQQFTVLIGSGARGRRSRITLYMEDVDSVEFDNSAGVDRGRAPASSVGSGDTDSATANSEPPARVPTTTRPSPVEPRSTAGAGTTNYPRRPAVNLPFRVPIFGAGFADVFSDQCARAGRQYGQWLDQ